MEQRRLGRTGHLSSVVTFGTAGIGKVDQETADLAVQMVLDRGVNHFDVAPRYGEAEVRLRPWMSCIRKQIFLGCKTAQRTVTLPRRTCRQSGGYRPAGSHQPRRQEAPRADSARRRGRETLTARRARYAGSGSGPPRRTADHWSLAPVRLDTVMFR
jgi:aryl-alcohol dehydrogenase-like predicted oxidoreductase